MKRITQQTLFAILVLMTVAFTSCDSMLDIKPVGSVIPQTLKEYRALLAASYRVVPNDRGLTSLRSDEMVLTSTSSYDQSSYSDIQIWKDYNNKPETRQFNWENLYKVLFTSNYIIEQHDAITEGSLAEINQLVGEAYALRAMMHFTLVNLFGEPYTRAGALETKSIPLKMNSDINEILSRNTVGEVYSTILPDLERAVELITTERWEPQFSYRFNTTAVKALITRVYLYMNHNEQTLAQAKLALAERSELEDFNQATALLPINYKSVESILALEYINDLNFQKANSPSATLLAMYEPGDLRPERYFAAPDKNGIVICLKGGKPDYRCSFRTAELYLNAAEAASALAGGESEARTLLLTLMKHRYTPEAYTRKVAAIELLTGTTLQEEIAAERIRELAFEGHRWFDLRRSTRPQLVKVIDGTTHTLEQDDRRYTLPIPQDAIDANPGLMN